MSSIKHKLIAALLAMALLAGSLSVLAPSYPVRALVPTAETISIPMILFQGVLKAVEGGLYVVLRKYVQQGIKNITKSTANYLFKGGQGKGPAYETKPWDNFWEEVGDEAVGAALEGFVQGAVNEYEAQKKKGEVYKSLEDTVEKDKQISLEGGDLSYKIRACYKEADALTEQKEIEDKEAECLATQRQLVEKEKEHKRFYEDNAGKMEAFGITGNYAKGMDARYKRLGELRDTESTECAKPEQRSKKCIDARDNTLKQTDDIRKYQLEQSEAFAAADKESGAAMAAIHKKQVEDDGKLVTGQTGALSEVGRTIVDIVCKPEADFALQIFLGLGDQISQIRRKPICPLDVLKKNWSRVITDAGFEPGGLLSEQTVTAWQSLASLVNPETSDLGVAWKISVAGHDVRDIARQLGVTDYGAIAAMGGYKGVTNLAETAIRSPAGAVGKAIDSTIESNFEGATRFVPTGHIVADILVTAGAAFLETTLDLVKDGLRKRQVVRRQPKGTNLSGLRPYLRSPIYSPDADPNAGTEAYAEAALAVFDELKYTGEQSWDVLNKITATGESSLCYDPLPQAKEEEKAADPESCTIDEDFNRAIREGMTVQQAMSAKPPLLNPDGIFGFNVTAENEIQGQPPISKNYPYNSLVILRKYRIIPVSWELAALYIKEKPDVCKEKNCTLGKLVAEFNKPDSNFYQMVDPNWVLMVPPTKCMLEGYGPQIIQELEVPDQANPEDKSKNTTQVVRAKTCVDYQTCLGQDATGKCERGYGYCLKEESVVHFTGEICEPQYNSCRSFTDATTKQNLTVLTDSLADYKSGRCTAENAGCAWYSKERQYQKDGAVFLLDNTNREKVLTTNTKTQKAWSNAHDKQVFLASTSSSLQKCEPQAEGCRQINGPAGTPPYLRLPPESLACATDGTVKNTTVQWYKREECKKYTQLCKSEYVGCERYLPQNDDIAVTGKSPDDSDTSASPRYKYRCPAACANIYAYAEQNTLFEALGNQPTTVARTVYFNVATAQKCSIADVGCEEFTNLDESRRGGEDKDYFTYLQRCVQEANPEGIPANEVFYHFVGSDTAGGQPEKHYVVGEPIDHDKNTETPTENAPKCADSAELCDCSAADAKQSLYDPRIGTSPCREFINANGKPFYRYTNNLIYRTPDCTSYRRTIDNQDGVTRTYSPGLSRRCVASAVNCREYHAPQAGNVRVLPKPDNFENQSVSGWQTGRSSNPDYVDARISNEGEILGDHSLKAAKKDLTKVVEFIQLAKRLPIQKDKTYHIRFHLKAPAGSQLNKLIIDPVKQGTDSTKVITLSYDEPELSGAWQQFQFTVTKDMMTPYELLDTSLFRITVSKNKASVDPEFYLDDVIIKEVDGIEYVIRDSWVENREASCFTPKGDRSPDFYSPAYPNCSLYTDRQGAQQAIRSFERICPNEMAGCVKVAITNGDIAKDSDGKLTGLIDKEAYLIPDASKACQASDNKCTAYGVPKLLTKADGTEQLKATENKASDESRNEWKYKEEWNVAYLKVTPEEALVAQNKFGVNDFTPYQSGICRTLDLGCRTYNPSGGGETYFRDPGKRICQPPDASYPNWYYYTCETSTSIICGSNDDCPITNDIQEKCNTNSKNLCSRPFVDMQNVTNVENINSRQCSCDKDDSNIDCKDAVVVRQNPGGAQICYDRFKKGNVNYFVSVHVDTYHLPSFVRSCPIDASGCRKITDPNCKLNTDGNYTLINNYGRTPGTVDSGIPCKQDYHFTEDFKTRTDECNSQVNPGAGCILFDDEKLQRFEYQINEGKHCEKTVTMACTAIGNNASDCLIPDSSPQANETCVYGPLAIAQNPSPPNPTYCVCDRNTGIESDCSEKFEASASDPDICYNRYYDLAATGERNLLRTYKKVRVESRYNSSAFYEEARTKGGATNVTVAAGATGDANTLIKVRPDRQCKVWLECLSRRPSGDGKTSSCSKRIACAGDKPGTACNDSLTDIDSHPFLNKLLKDAEGVCNMRRTRSCKIDTDCPVLRNRTQDACVTATPEEKRIFGQRKELLTLSGYARPDYKFTDGTTTMGGYSANFSEWVQAGIPSTVTAVSNLSYQRNVPPYLPEPNSSTDLGEGYLSMCRLYPKQDSPSTIVEGKITDACQAISGSSGIYGYCLQPNPQFTSEYGLSALPTRYCRNAIGTTCQSDSNCPGYADNPPNPDARCVYRYYENYCLNWLPIDRTGQEQVFRSSDAQPFNPKTFPENGIYYCIKKDGPVTAKGFDPPIVIDTLPEETELIHPANTDYQARDSSGIYEADDNDCPSGKGWFNNNPVVGDKKAQCGQGKDFNEWNDTPGAENIIILQVGSTSYDYKSHQVSGSRNANNKEKLIHKDDIRSIFIDDPKIFAFNFHFPLTKSPDLFYNKYTNNSREATVVWSDMEDIVRDPGFIKNYSAFSGSSCDNSSGRVLAYLTVRARFDGNNELAGWELAHCGFDAFTFNSSLDAVVSLSITMDVKERKRVKFHEEKITRSYKDTYCSELVKVATDTNAVLDHSKAPDNKYPTSVPDDALIRSIVSGADNSIYIVKDRVTVCDDPDPRNVGRTYPLCTPGINGSNGLGDDPDNIEKWKEFLKVYPPHPDLPLPQIMPIIDPKTNLSGIRESTPFAKAYEYWKWTSNNKYEKVADLKNLSMPGTDATALTALKKFWEESTKKASSEDNRPRVYDNQHRVNRFNVTPSGDQLTVSFFAKVKDNQLPIKRYTVFMPHGRKDPQAVTDFQDGIGVEDNFFGVDPRNVKPTSQKRNKAFGDFWQHYPENKYGQKPFKNEQVCIEIKDNWDACTRTCGRFDTNGDWKENEPATWIPPTDCIN